MTIYCVVVDAGGAHEAECVYSLWSTREKAEAEIARLLAKDAEIKAREFRSPSDPDWHFVLGCYGDPNVTVVEVEMDQPRNEWIG